MKGLKTGTGTVLLGKIKEKGLSYFFPPSGLKPVFSYLLHRNVQYLTFEPGRNIEVHKRPCFKRVSLIPVQFFPEQLKSRDHFARRQ